MPKSDIIVMGTSAGGVQALRTVAADLPSDLPAAVFTVLHIGSGADGRSALPDILERAGRLPAKHPRDGEEIRPGTIYVAPPDCHMLVSPGRIHLSGGPKENHTRPAINPLFRSAARAYRGRVAGVILTGLLDDGVAGLAEIKRRGGRTMAQDPATALFPSMPVNAIKHVDVDHILPLEQMGAAIAKLASQEHHAMEKEEPVERTSVALTCPECRGPITQERQGRIIEYRCRVGHVYSPLVMAAAHEETVERALWASVVALEEAADINEHIGAQSGDQTAEAARVQRRNAEIIREMLNRTERSGHT